MDIRDQKLIQLFRKTSSSQVNSRSLRVLQQSIGDVTIYTEHVCGLHIYFLRNNEGYTSLFSKNIKELFMICQLL